MAQVGESVDSYHVGLEIRPDGSLRVEEVISYQFGANARHGITRHIPVRAPFDDHHIRIWRISNIHGATSPATPSDVKVSDEGDITVIRTAIRPAPAGAHSYTIDYDVDGALDRSSGQPVLHWNAIGDEWHVPVAHAQWS